MTRARRRRIKAITRDMRRLRPLAERYNHRLTVEEPGTAAHQEARRTRNAIVARIKALASERAHLEEQIAAETPTRRNKVGHPNRDRWNESPVNPQDTPETFHPTGENR